ncbi:MAG: alpha/beta hydrolase [Bacteroidaceae bacterium]|nr:alpha/beta hydrolase [Bacteroidaceae bacterium]
MRKFIILAVSFLVALSAFGQTRKEVVRIWPNGAPTSNGLTGPEKDYGDHVSNVTDPIMTLYIADKPNGKAVLAIPGGSYIDVWDQTEGHWMADWYNAQGITLAVLKYRLPNGHTEVPLADVQEAMRLLRDRAGELGIIHLGIQGCSAGGHLAATAATHFTTAGNRPDFQILFYPVITMDDAFTHRDSRRNLLGKDPSEDMMELYSNEKQVSPETPPAFILHSSDDGLVPVRNSIEYYNALVQNHVSATMHLYPTGGHGWCGHTTFAYRSQWMSELQHWLEQF